MAIILTQTHRYGNLRYQFNADDGTCMVETPTRVVVGTEQVYKEQRQTRPRPSNLTAYTSLTSRGPQRLFSLNYGKYATVIDKTVICKGAGKFGTEYKEYGLSRSGPITFPRTLNWEQAIREKIASEQVSFAENIGEWRESVKMLKAGSDVMAKAWRNARDIFRAARSRKRITQKVRASLGYHWKPETKFHWLDAVSTHLAITYGIRPIIGQLEDVLDQLDRVKMLKIVVQATISEEVGPSVYTQSGMDGSATVKGRISQRARFYVTFKNNHGDFTTGNLASSLWAGTKLSFMVDWFANIGGYLESLTALDGVVGVAGTVTTKKYSTASSDIRPKGTILVEKYHDRKTYQERTVFNSIPLPARVNIRVPSGGNTLDQLVSAVEILTQMRVNRPNVRVPLRFDKTAMD